MKLTVKKFDHDYWSHDVGVGVGNEAKLKKGLKRQLSKARRNEAKDIKRKSVEL